MFSRCVLLLLFLIVPVAAQEAELRQRARVHHNLSAVSDREAVSSAYYRPGFLQLRTPPGCPPPEVVLYPARKQDGTSVFLLVPQDGGESVLWEDGTLEPALLLADGGILSLPLPPSFSEPEKLPEHSPSIVWPDGNRRALEVEVGPEVALEEEEIAYLVGGVNVDIFWQWNTGLRVGDRAVLVVDLALEGWHGDRHYFGSSRLLDLDLDSGEARWHRDVSPAFAQAVLRTPEDKLIFIASDRLSIYLPGRGFEKTVEFEKELFDPYDQGTSTVEAIGYRDGKVYLTSNLYTTKGILRAFCYDLATESLQELGRWEQDTPFAGGGSLTEDGYLKLEGGERTTILP